MLQWIRTQNNTGWCGSQLFIAAAFALLTCDLVAAFVDGSENVTGLDLSDFPALADRSRREGSGSQTPLLNPLAGRAPYGMIPVLHVLYRHYSLPIGPSSCHLFFFFIIVKAIYYIRFYVLEGLVGD